MRKAQVTITININVVANAGTICHWPKCAVFMWHQCERRLNENVTTRTETKQKKKQWKFPEMKKKVRKKLNALGMVDGGRVRESGHLMLVSTIFVQVHFARAIISTFLCENARVIFFFSRATFLRSWMHEYVLLQAFLSCGNIASKHTLE